MSNIKGKPTTTEYVEYTTDSVIKLFTLHNLGYLNKCVCASTTYTLLVATTLLYIIFFPGFN